MKIFRAIMIAFGSSFAGLVAFFLMAEPLFSQPPKKVYTRTQWTLRSLAEAADQYRSSYGAWPVDDKDSTFLYKLMGGGVRRPSLAYGGRENVYATCQVYGMTSPSQSPWALGPKGETGHSPYAIPSSNIPWPEEHELRASASGGSGEFHLDNWDKVPRDPKICPWLATDVVGFDALGGRYHCRGSGNGCVVYSEGRNQRDNGGGWDDIHESLTLGMLATYHPEYFALLAGIVLFLVILNYYVGFRPLWREKRPVAGSRR